jgi:hypothetical protein
MKQRETTWTNVKQVLLLPMPTCIILSDDTCTVLHRHCPCQFGWTSAMFTSTSLLLEHVEGVNTCRCLFSVMWLCLVKLRMLVSWCHTELQGLVRVGGLEDVSGYPWMIMNDLQWSDFAPYGCQVWPKHRMMDSHWNRLGSFGFINST